MDPQTERILAALGYIEQHLCEPIMVSDIARAAGYSLFHFIRTFNKIVRHTPYDYLMRRRPWRVSLRRMRALPEPLAGCSG